VCQGFGVLQYRNGERYEGHWKDDTAHGKGTLTYAGGDRYVGEWSEGEENGRMAGLSGASLRPRHPLEGDMHGELLSVWDSHGSMDVSGKKHGQGELHYINGDVFRGEWRNDYASGQGVLHYANGDVYTGQVGAGCKAKGSLWDGCPPFTAS
jgi:hypothetical protein